jgi:hypothetical protein
MTISKIEEEFIQKDQQHEFIYVRLGYLYTILPNSPCSHLGDLSITRVSHVVDGVIRLFFIIVQTHITLDLICMVTHMVELVPLIPHPLQGVLQCLTITLSIHQMPLIPCLQWN